jgi:hypothetical protein
MHTRRLLVLGVSALVLLMTSFVRAQQTSTPARPIVELEKPRFASNEQIFFWIGVTAPDNYRIPESLRTSGRLTITRPDGTTRVDVVGWPIDGPGDRGWRGGHGLRGETPQIGRYTLVMEFAGYKTDPVSFVVENIPAASQITGEFEFPPALSLGSGNAVVTLVVRNGSTEEIRFPHRGVTMAEVWVRLDKKVGERWGASFFVPHAVLLSAAGIQPSRIGETTFTWNLVDRVPTVTLPAGGTYRLPLPLAPTLSAYIGRMPSGEYEIVFGTSVQILVGARDGAHADLAPLRLAVSSTSRAVR